MTSFALVLAYVHLALHWKMADFALSIRKDWERLPLGAEAAVSADEQAS